MKKQTTEEEEPEGTGKNQERLPEKLIFRTASFALIYKKNFLFGT